MGQNKSRNCLSSGPAEDEKAAGNDDSAAGPLSTQTVEEVFKSIDVNGDGVLSVSEVSGFMNRLGLTLSPAQVCSIMKEMDQDGDSMLNIHDFSAWYNKAAELKQLYMNDNHLAVRYGQKDKLLRPYVCAHRGASGYRPPHTLKGYYEAVLAGAEYVEYDVVSTKDGHLLISHDVILDLDTNVAQVFPKDKHPELFTKKKVYNEDGDPLEFEGYFAADFTLEQIKQLGKTQQFVFRSSDDDALFPLVTVVEASRYIEQLRKKVGRNIGLMIELKKPKWHRSIGLPMVDKLVEDLKTADFQGPIAIQCFEKEPLVELSARFADWYYMKLVIDQESLATVGNDVSLGVPVAEDKQRLFIEEIAEYADCASFWKRSIVPNPSQPPVRSTLVDLCHELGLEACAYTFRSDVFFLDKEYHGNAAEEYALFFRLGLDGLFSDFPSHAVHAREVFFTENRALWLFTGHWRHGSNHKHKEPLSATSPVAGSRPHSQFEEKDLLLAVRSQQITLRSGDKQPRYHAHVAAQDDHKLGDKERSHMPLNAAPVVSAAEFTASQVDIEPQPKWRQSLSTTLTDKHTIQAPPTRRALLKKLEDEEFDILIIGGGATGVGAALEATRRGHKVALVEKYDFASGTSSRSTNMLHGGVRYLQNARKQTDPAKREAELKLVRKGLLQENFIYNSAPYMVHALPIMVPCYSEEDKQRFGDLLKNYDDLSQDNPFPESYYATRKEILFQFPHLNPKDLVGAWIYYDGQQDDARMALLLALTSVEKGACVVNYMGVQALTKSDAGKVVGAKCIDTLTEKELSISAKVVLNATGPFSDFIRKLDSPSVPDIIVPAAGTHIVLGDHFSPDRTGLVIMETSDGRVLFYLPWQGNTLVGTTDKLVEVTDMPTPSDEEIDFILKEVNEYLDDSLQASRKDILSAWTGIRPLAKGAASLTGTGSATEEKAQDKDTKSVTREHVVMVSESNLVSIAGGKWTTYRAMAKDAINKVESVGGLQAQAPPSPRVDAGKSSGKLFGSMGHGGHIGLVGADRSGACCSQKFQLNVIKLRQVYHLSREVAEQLSLSYGTRALQVAELQALLDADVIPVEDVNVNYVLPCMKGRRLSVNVTGMGALLHSEHPYVVAQVYYAIHYEYASYIVDVLSRRIRLAQVDVLAAAEVVPRVCAIMKRELSWTQRQVEQQLEYTERFLNSMGLALRLENL